MIIRYFLYLIRWQLSTPLLAVSIIYFSKYGEFWSTVIANFIGGLIFFWVDKYIFTKKFDKPIWQVRSIVTCSDCGRRGRGYRLVQTKDYDRSQDSEPKFRCEVCSARKANELKDSGIDIE